MSLKKKVLELEKVVAELKSRIKQSTCKHVFKIQSISIEYPSGSSLLSHDIRYVDISYICTRCCYKNECFCGDPDVQNFHAKIMTLIEENENAK